MGVCYSGTAVPTISDDQKPEKADARTDEQKRAETRRKFTQTEPVSMTSLPVSCARLSGYIISAGKREAIVCPNGSVSYEGAQLLISLPLETRPWTIRIRPAAAEGEQELAGEVEHTNGSRYSGSATADILELDELRIIENVRFDLYSPVDGSETKSITIEGSLSWKIDANVESEKAESGEPDIESDFAGDRSH